MYLISFSFQNALINNIETLFCLKTKSRKYHRNVVTGSLDILDVGVEDVGSYSCTVSTQGHAPVVSAPGQLHVSSKLYFKVDYIG